MSTLTHAQYIVRMRDDYFTGVMREDRNLVWSCFTDDARVTIYHGDNPIQQFYKNAKPGQQSFDFFYGHLWQNYHVHFGDYRFVVDTEQGHCAATFVPTLNPKPGSNYLETGRLTLNNCNFFWFRGRDIADMIIYYANPTLGAAMGLSAKMPTAFPKS
jgi:hypothetical protein